MAIVRMTVRQLDKLGLWEKVREYKGWNPYIRNEGQISEDEIVEFDDDFKKEDIIDYRNKVQIVGTIILERNDSPNDFEELFLEFLKKYKWELNGKIELID
jgi:hypothetical protein